MIKVEIILWLLLTLALLMKLIVYIYKNKKSFFTNILNVSLDKINDTSVVKHSTWTIWQKLEKIKEKAKSIEIEKNEHNTNKGTKWNSSTQNKSTYKDIFDKIDDELLWKSSKEMKIDKKNNDKSNQTILDHIPVDKSVEKNDNSQRNKDIISSGSSENKNTLHNFGKEQDKETTKSPYSSRENTLSPIEKQRAKEKEQQKLKDIRISALTHKERGRIDEYEKKLIEWLAIDPNNKDFLERLSDYYFLSWHHIKAMTLLKKLVNQSPEDHKAIRQIWQIYVTQEDFDTARILIEKAISVKNDNPKYHITLVDIHYTQNNLKEAIKAMEKVLKLRPTNINYLLSIATLHEEASEPTKAFWYYSKIIEIDPMHELAKDWLKRLG